MLVGINMVIVNLGGDPKNNTMNSSYPKGLRGFCFSNSKPLCCHEFEMSFKSCKGFGVVEH